VDQHRLAGDQIEARVVERERLGAPFDVAKPLREPGALGRGRGLAHPGGLAVHADDLRLRRQDRTEQPPPVADAAADVERRGDVAEADPARDQRELVEVPPMVALGPEELDGMWPVPALTSHAAIIGGAQVAAR
jgi:hypothetical protein